MNKISGSDDWFLSRSRGDRSKLHKVAKLSVYFILISSCIAHGQTTKSIPKVGFISSTGSPESPSPLFEAFRQGLRELDYIDGRNVAIVHRYAEGRLDRMPPFVQEFVQQKVDVILGGNNVVIRAAKEATNTIPLVIVSSVDPVEAGYVESFARPGGNITGLAWLNRDVSAKRLELLRELLPKLSRAGILWDAAGPGPKVAFKEYTAAAKAFKVELRSLEVEGANPDFEGAFQLAKTVRSEAIIVVGNPLMSQHTKRIFDLAIKFRLPSMTEEDRYVMAGGLISYGANFADLYRRAAGYVVDIIKGAKPAELPIKVASKFDIFVNLKTAQETGVAVPQRVLLQADKVIK